MLIRRPIQARGTVWAQWMTQQLVKMGIRPNSISLASLVFSSSAALTLYLTTNSELQHKPLWPLAALFIGLRLLANMLDGMVAQQSGQLSPLGDLFNELPDRLSDSLILISAGYVATGGASLGLFLALLANWTAYIRTFGNWLGVQNLYGGPIAKQQRMFILIFLCICQLILPSEPAGTLWHTGLYLIIVGSMITILHRLNRVVQGVRQA